MALGDFIFWGIILIIIISIIYYNLRIQPEFTVKINGIDVPAKYVLEDKCLEDKCLEDKYLFGEKNPNGNKVWKLRYFPKDIMLDYDRQMWIQPDGQEFPLLNSKR